MNHQSYFARLLPGLLLMVFTNTAVASNFNIETSFSAGSTNNLFADSSGFNDTYSTVSAEFDYLPVSFGKISLQSEYSYYGNSFNLSNLLYGGGLTIVPLSDSSHWSVYLTGNYRDREYRPSDAGEGGINANEFTGAEYDALLAFGYQTVGSLRLRTGLAFQSYGYNIEGVIDRENLDLFTGLSTTLWNRVGLDIEGGYSHGKFQHVNPFVFVLGQDRPRGAISADSAYAILLEDNLNSTYLSARLSSGLGARTGLALTLSLRRFVDQPDDAIIYGYSSGYLSPWVGSHEGSGIVGSLKTYLIPRLISSLKIGYWHRSYLKMVEREAQERFGQISYVVNPQLAQERTDYRWRLNLKIEFPFGHSIKGTFIEPTLQLGYTDNNSTDLVYDYQVFDISGGLTVRF